MFDGTVKIKPWIPPTQSHLLNVKKLKEIIEELPDDFTVTVDDLDWIFYEIDFDERRVDFTRDYKDGA